MNIICLKDVTKIYGQNQYKVTALNSVNLTVSKGEMVAIMGPSGSGKSTLLNILGCMDVPTSGEYYINNKLIYGLSNNELSKIRNLTISFIFQHFALMDAYSVYDNIELPLVHRKVSKNYKNDLITKYASQLGIKDQLHKKPSELSGGQQQRVAIARALVSDADVILADEPTGALDQQTGKSLIELLRNINKEGKTIIIVTHDSKIADSCDRTIIINDGKIIS